jgi:hypothetical protein
MLVRNANNHNIDIFQGEMGSLIFRFIELFLVTIIYPSGQILVNCYHNKPTYFSTCDFAHMLCDVISNCDMDITQFPMVN